MAHGRLSAGFLFDLRKDPRVSKVSKTMPGGFDNYNDASIGVAWSDDLKNWDWPGKK